MCYEIRRAEACVDFLFCLFVEIKISLQNTL